MCVLRKQYTLVGKETQTRFILDRTNKRRCKAFSGDHRHRTRKKEKNNNKKTLFSNFCFTCSYPD